MARSDPTFYQNTVLSRPVEVPAADWVEGVNRGGSCSPGVGIGTGAGAVNPPQWTVPDQYGVARNPQNGQHIGELAADDARAGGGTPYNVADYETSDFNDTVSLTNVNTGWVRNPVV